MDGCDFESYFSYTLLMQDGGTTLDLATDDIKAFVNGLG